MKYQSLLIIIAIFFLLGSSCKKDKLVNEIDKLPPATQTGANTFGCLVNGKAWIAQNKDCSIICDDPFKIFYDGINGGNLSIIGLNKDVKRPINQSISIGMDSTNYKTDFILSPNTALNLGFTFVNNGIFIRSWDSLVIATGRIKLLKYDLVNGIISGNFEFTLASPNNEIINITSGRFDKKL